MKKAVIYARFSSYNQQEQSIEGQIRACRDYARYHDLEIVKEYCDRAKSGTNSNRPEFQKMLKESELGGFEIVLVYQYDRFARNRRESCNNEFILQANGVKLISINEPIDDEDSSSVIFKGLLESMAEYYSRDLSRKVKRGIKESIIHRKAIGGKRWLGYKVNSEMKIVVDELEALVVKKIFAMRLAGDKVEVIAKSLNDKNLTNKGKKFTKQAVNNILKNEKYTGRYINPYDPTEIITDMYPEIIDRETFDAVQEGFIHYRCNSCRGVKNPSNYVLSGKLFSAIDGSMFTGVSGYSATGRKYCYYKAKIEDVTVKYSARELEDSIIETLKEILSQDEYVQYLSSRMVEAVKNNAKNSNIQALKNEKAALEKQIVKIRDAFIEAEKEMRVELNKKLQEIRSQIDEIDKNISLSDVDDLKIFQDVDLLKEYLREYLGQDLDSEKNRSNFFKTLLNTAFISENHVDIYLNFDVSNKISFAEYKNDVLQLENVRFRYNMAVKYTSDTNFDAYFFRNQLYISLTLPIKWRQTP